MSTESYHVLLCMNKVHANKKQHVHCVTQFQKHIQIQHYKHEESLC